RDMVAMIMPPLPRFGMTGGAPQAPSPQRRNDFGSNNAACLQSMLRDENARFTRAFSSMGWISPRTGKYSRPISLGAFKNQGNSRCIFLAMAGCDGFIKACKKVLGTGRINAYLVGKTKSIEQVFLGVGYGKGFFRKM